MRLLSASLSRWPTSSNSRCSSFVHVRTREHWCSPNKYGRSPFGRSAISMSERTPKSSAMSALGWCVWEPPRRSAPEEASATRATSALSGVIGQSWPKAAAPGNSGRVRSMMGLQEGAWGSHG
jgi:hypothetical protein